MSSSFRNFFNNLLLEEQNKIIDMVDKSAKAQYTKTQLKSPKSSKPNTTKSKPQNVIKSNTVNVYEIPEVIRTYSIKIKHTKLLDDGIEIELFNLDDIDNTLKILRNLGIKSYNLNDLVITIKG